MKEVVHEVAPDTPLEIWFMDEARVGQQGTLTRIWAKRGTRPRAVRDHRYTWAWIFGAVCPERAVGAAVVLPEVNVEAMNIHLAEISRCVSKGAHAVLGSTVRAGTPHPGCTCPRTSACSRCPATRPS